MAQSVKRLTIYALISALELDLREFVTLHVIPVLGQTNLLSNSVSKKAESRFEEDNPGETPKIEELLNYIDLDEEIKAIRRHENLLDSATRTYIKRYYFGL